MELELFRHETNKIWQRTPGEPVDTLLQYELDIYKKLLEYFQVGDCCYFIFNFQMQELDYASKETINVLGYSHEEITINTIFENIHPDDRAWFLACQEVAIKFIKNLPPEKQMKYKLQIDYRIRKKTGEYIRALQQSIVIHTDGKEGIYRSMVVFTDITHLKSQGKPQMQYIGMDGEPSYYNVEVHNPFLQKEEKFTKREKQVLKLLATGKVSKEIAEILQITKLTVDNHRKNMLSKTGLHTTPELINYAIKEEWL